MCLLVLSGGGCGGLGSSPSHAAPATEASGTLVLMGTTDMHGWLLPVDYFTGSETPNGLARLLPMIDSIRAAHPGRTALFDSGDLLQGNPLAFVYSHLEPREVHPVIRAMNLAGYDAAAVGNHEFNYGIEHLRVAIAQAAFSFLSANVFRAGTEQHAFASFAVLEREVAGRTVRIGVTGVTPPGVMLWDRDNVRGRLEVREIVSSVRAAVAEMRHAGADLVVVLSHGGFEGTSYDTAATGIPVENASAAIAREISGVDVIFMGHTHEEVADTTIAGTLLLQAKNWGGSLAVAELELRTGDAGWEVVSKHGGTLRPDSAALAPRLVEALSTADRRTRDYVSRPIGSSAAEWSAATARVRDTPILDLINEVQRQATGADLSGTAAFTLDARIPEGPVTVADIARLYIYDNTLKALRISGADLRAYLEKSAEYYLPCPGASCAQLINPGIPGYNFDVVSGVDYELDLSRPVGERVVQLEYEGHPVQPGDSFTIALNNYRASGSGGFSMFTDAPVVYDRGESIRDLLIGEIEHSDTISPDGVFRRNWRIVPKPLAAQALREQSRSRR